MCLLDGIWMIFYIHCEYACKNKNKQNRFFEHSKKKMPVNFAIILSINNVSVLAFCILFVKLQICFSIWQFWNILSTVPINKSNKEILSYGNVFILCLSKNRLISNWWECQMVNAYFITFELCVSDPIKCGLSTKIIQIIPLSKPMLSKVNSLHA